MLSKRSRSASSSTCGSFAAPAPLPVVSLSTYDTNSFLEILPSEPATFLKSCNRSGATDSSRSEFLTTAPTSRNPVDLLSTLLKTATASRLLFRFLGMAPRHMRSARLDHAPEIETGRGSNSYLAPGSSAVAS